MNSKGLDLKVIQSDNGWLYYVIEPMEGKIVSVCWTEEEAWRLASKYTHYG